MVLENCWCSWKSTVWIDYARETVAGLSTRVAGMVKKKVLPRCGSLSNHMRPPIISTSRFEMVRPKARAAVLPGGRSVGLLERSRR